MIFCIWRNVLVRMQLARECIANDDGLRAHVCACACVCLCVCLCVFWIAYFWMHPNAYERRMDEWWMIDCGFPKRFYILVFYFYLFIWYISLAFGMACILDRFRFHLNEYTNAYTINCDMYSSKPNIVIYVSIFSSWLLLYCVVMLLLSATQRKVHI